jgi:hypothetical protein
MHSRVVAEVIMKIKEMGSIIEQDQPTDLLTINGEFTTSLVIARCRRTQAGSLRWFVRLDTGLEPDITVVLRMDPPNENTLDYYLLPLIDMTVERLRLSEENGAIIDSYRFDTLDFFFGMAERVRIKVAA